MIQITVGCRVAFSREFLRNTGQYTGWAPFARGEVIEISTFSGGVTLVNVAWDHTASSRVNIKNLVREDRIHLEPV
jgi:hypothetical protein